VNNVTNKHYLQLYTQQQCPCRTLPQLSYFITAIKYLKAGDLLIMVVRIYDKERETYFKSEVYAMINIGCYARYLVLVSGPDENYFKFYDMFDESANPQLNIAVSARPAEWIYKDKDFLSEIKVLSDTNVRLNTFWGYDWVLEKTALFAKLLKGEKVNLGESGFPLVDSSLSGWNYIEAQKDIDSLLTAVGGFHDSFIINLEYISGKRIGNKKRSDNEISCEHHDEKLRALKMIFDSIWWESSLELVFEGVITLHLLPARDNFSGEMFDASVTLKDEIVLFKDESDFTTGADCTLVKAYSLRWRFTP